MKNISIENYKRVAEILAEAHRNMRKLNEETQNRHGDSTIEIEFWNRTVSFSFSSSNFPRLILQIHRNWDGSDLDLPYNVDQIGLKKRAKYLGVKDLIWLVKNWPTIYYRLQKKLCKADAKLARTLI